MRVVAAPEDELRSHLDSGEKLLWAGRPAQGIVLMWQDWFLIPFGMVWFGSAVRFSIQGSWPASNKNPPPFALFVAFALLIIGTGIYLVIGRLLVDLWFRSRTIYGVTDRRAIILSGMRRRSVHSIYFSSLITLKLEERRNRSGTIYLGEDRPPYRHDPHDGSEFGGFGPSGQTRLGEEQFFQIADAKKVFTILQEAIRRSRSSRHANLTLTAGSPFR
jgi:hypothetical protein